MTEIKVHPAPPRREFDGKQYILTTVDYTKEAAADDEAYQKERGRITKVIEEEGYWLLYTKIGQ